MRKILSLIVLCVLGLNSLAGAVITVIDFESCPAGSMSSYTESGVTFTPVTAGKQFYATLSPSGSNGIIGTTIAYTEIRADISGGTNFVSIDLGDYGQDSDLLFLEIYDACDVLIDSTTLLIDGQFVGMKTLSLSHSSIFSAVFGARDPALNGSSVYADNFKFESSCIPAPGAVILAAMGTSIVGYLRRRKTL